MRQLDKIIFLLILVKVNVLQSKPILGCSCAKDVPLVLNVPVAPPPAVVPCPTHGYKIEVPPPPALAAAKPSLPLDLVVEAPVPCAPPPVCDPNLYAPIAAPAPLPAPLPAPCGCAAPVLPPAPLPAALPPPAPLPAALPPPALAPCGCALPALPPAPLSAALPPPALAPCGCALPALPPAPLPAALPPPALAPCGCALPALPPAPLPAALPPPALAPCGCALPALPPAPLPVALPPPALAPCGCALPALPPAPLPVALPAPVLPCAPPALPALVDDFSGVAALKAPLPAAVTYELIPSALPAVPPAPLPGAFSLPLSDLICACEKTPPPEPPCRYVSKDIESNIIYRGRSKREVATFKHKSMDEILGYVKSLKTTRVARKAKKSRLVKRDIKGEYDLLQREQSQMDLTIPEIIQYMPETMMPNFKRGKCNFGCKNCINLESNEKLKTKQNSALPTEINNKENDQPSEQQQKALNENPTESPNQHFDLSPQSAEENYFKRSVNTFQNQNPNPGYSGLLPPPYISSAMELTKLAQNPGNPIWYQPQPLTDTNVEYVYDRLGHKYKVKNGSFKLVTPSEQNDDEVNNRSTHVASAENTEEPTTTTTTTTTTTDKAEALDSSVPSASDQQMIDEEARKMFDSALQKHDFIDVNAPSVDNAQTMIQTPIVGAPSAQQHKPTSDPHMDKIIRDIVYQHPDFIDASQHAPGSLTLPEEVTRDETMHFLDKLIRGRLSKWFGEPSEEVPMHRLQDLNRYSRETGTSIKFIPVVTVDKDRLDKFRQTNSEDFTSR